MIFDPSPINEEAVIEPVVVRFSSPKDMLPPVSVIKPSDKVRFPTEDPVPSVVVPALKVPVVDIFSSPNDILHP